MKNIIISLNSAKKRRDHIHKQFSKDHVSYSFFDALVPDQAKAMAEQLGIKYDEDCLTDNEFACLMSHVSLWKKSVDDKIPYVAIFEDDVYLGENAEYYLNNTQWMQNEWQIVKLEAFSKHVFLDNKKHILPKDDRVITQLKGKNLGAAGYILSEKGANFLLDYICQNTISEPLDHIIFDHCIKLNQIKVYQMNPALCIQCSVHSGTHSRLPSSLEDQRILRRKNESKKRSITTKIKREFYRLYNNLLRLFFSKKVFFK